PGTSQRRPRDDGGCVQGFLSSHPPKAEHVGGDPRARPLRPLLLLPGPREDHRPLRLVPRLQEGSPQAQDAHPPHRQSHGARQGREKQGAVLPPTRNFRRA
ncbi:unnamed protein product, partial [Ectocarpus sp. 12 AP-2014]